MRALILLYILIIWSLGVLAKTPLEPRKSDSDEYVYLSHEFEKKVRAYHREAKYRPSKKPACPVPLNSCQAYPGRVVTPAFYFELLTGERGWFCPNTTEVYFCP